MWVHAWPAGLRRGLCAFTHIPGSWVGCLQALEDDGGVLTGPKVDQDEVESAYRA